MMDSQHTGRNYPPTARIRQCVAPTIFYIFYYGIYNLLKKNATKLSAVDNRTRVITAVFYYRVAEKKTRMFYK